MDERWIKKLDIDRVMEQLGLSRERFMLFVQGEAAEKGSRKRNYKEYSRQEKVSVGNEEV